MIIRTLTIIIIIMAYSNLVLSQDLTFEEYNPKSTLVVPGDSILKAKYPFIDVHGHQYRMPEQDLTPVVAAMDTLNMAIMVNLSGRSGADLIKSMENINTNFPGRFVLFCNISLMWNLVKLAIIKKRTKRIQILQTCHLIH